MNVLHSLTFPRKTARALLTPALLAFCLSGLIACGGSARDYVLVVDTSGSMEVGTEERKSTMNKVRRSMQSFMQSVNPGDTVTLLGFDAETRNLGTFSINSEADRAGPVNAVRDLEASGRHTFMKAMVSSVSETVRELEGRGRNVIVVIMSDGKDDPPPGETDNRLALAEIQDTTASAGNERLVDTFIYYVSLGKLKDPSLEAELRKLSPDVKTIEKQSKPASQSNSGAKGAAASGTAGDSGKSMADANGTQAEGAGAGAAGEGDAAADAEGADADGDEIGLSEVAQDVADRSWYKQLKAIGTIAAPIIFGILFLIWLWRKWQNRHKVNGTLTYYEADVGSPLKNNFDLAKTQKSAVAVGSKVGADLKVRQSGLPRNISLKAVHKSGEDFLKPASADEALFKFNTRQQDELISKGDSFRLGNYVFEYGDGEKN